MKVDVEMICPFCNKAMKQIGYPNKNQEMYQCKPCGFQMLLTVGEKMPLKPGVSKEIIQPPQNKK